MTSELLELLPLAFSIRHFIDILLVTSLLLFSVLRFVKIILLNEYGSRLFTSEINMHGAGYKTQNSSSRTTKFTNPERPMKL